MYHVRLTGLILFITTIFLGLAAAATQTWTIKVKRPSWAGRSSTIPDGAKADAPLVTNENSPVAPLDAQPASGQGSDAAKSSALQFMEVPVFRPLVFFGILGLILWFVPAGVTTGFSPAKKRRRKSRRKR